MHNEPLPDPKAHASKRRSVGITLLTVGALLLIATLGRDAEPPRRVIQTVASPISSPSGIENRAWPLGVFPENIERAAAQIREAYVFASYPTNLPTMRAMKCYCGCDAGLDHKSLYNCYVEKLLPGAKVVYSNHALNCLTCQSEVWDAQKWQKEGKGPEEIARLIDSTYYGK